MFSAPPHFAAADASVALVDTSGKATAEDFGRLRRVQLQQLCQKVSLERGGNKGHLIERLLAHGGWDKTEILSLQQAFQYTVKVGKVSNAKTAPKTEGIEPQSAKSTVDKIGRSISRSSSQTVVGKKERISEARRYTPRPISDEGLLELLWAVSDRRITCEQCASPLQPRNGRFGLYLACSRAPSCTRHENIGAALARLGEDACPVRFIFELEDTEHFRVHARGTRDCNLLREWVSVSGISSQSATPRVDWLSESLRSSWGDAGLGLNGRQTCESHSAASTSRPEFLGYLFDIDELQLIEDKLKQLMQVTMETIGPSLHVHLDPLPGAALRFLSSCCDTKLKHDPISARVDNLTWLRSVVEEIFGKSWYDGIPCGASSVLDGPPSKSVLPGSGEALRDVLRCRTISNEVWESQILHAVNFMPVIETAGGTSLDWKSFLEITSNAMCTDSFKDSTKHKRVKLPSYLVKAEAQRLLDRACAVCPRLTCLRPFQRTGVARALALGGRCLLADEMGCGKTPQALAAIAAYSAWPVLIICPASMRLVWAEELERWLPELFTPKNIHIIYSSNDMLPQSRVLGSLGDIRICIVSFAMARLLHENLSGRQWKLAIVDESHTLRLARGKPCTATLAVLDLLKSVPRVLLLSGTPSATSYLDVYAQADLLYPGLLGDSWDEFNQDYDDPTLSASGHLISGHCRRGWQLGLLLREAVMVRRLKRDVLKELPDKQRRILRLALQVEASAKLSEKESSVLTDYERCGLLKIVVAEDWFRDRLQSCSRGEEKMVVFAHHLKVLDRVCAMAEALDIPLIRIDGSTPSLLRQSLLIQFRCTDRGSPTLAVVGVTACAIGIDLSAASLAVFVELPPDASWLSQAEDRLHRQGQRRPVDIVLLLAHAVVGQQVRKELPWGRGCVKRCCDSDAYRWRNLQRVLAEVSSVHDAPLRVVKDGLSVATAPLSHNKDEAIDPLEKFPAQALAMVTAIGEDADFSFEPSPYTGRLHVFLNCRALGYSLPADGVFANRIPSALASQAYEFRAAWSGMTAYQKRLFRGKVLTAKALSSGPCASSLTGSRTRYVLRRHSSTDTEDGCCPGPRCEVIVTYTRGRFSGQVVRFLQPIAIGADVAACCMECRTPLDTSSCQKLLPSESPTLGPAGENITHYREDMESSLFCTGRCRGNFFAKRNGRSLRQQLFELERGVCQNCGLDCQAVLASILAAGSMERRRMRLLEVAPQVAADTSLCQRLFTIEKPTSGLLWEADHITPVWAGGGTCGLDNLQTLCAPCHKAKTKAEAEHRANSSAQAKRTSTLRSKRPSKRFRRTLGPKSDAEIKEDNMKGIPQKSTHVSSRLSPHSLLRSNHEVDLKLGRRPKAHVSGGMIFTANLRNLSPIESSQSPAEVTNKDGASLGSSVWAKGLLRTTNLCFPKATLDKGEARLSVSTGSLSIGATAIAIGATSRVASIDLDDSDG